jgi:hypothetical protein
MAGDAAEVLELLEAVESAELTKAVLGVGAPARLVEVAVVVGQARHERGERVLDDRAREAGARHVRLREKVVVVAQAVHAGHDHRPHELLGGALPLSLGGGS